MSFGVGFGDIAKAVGLAREVVTRYREAPKHVNDLATEYVRRTNSRPLSPLPKFLPLYLMASLSIFIDLF